MPVYDDETIIKQIDDSSLDNEVKGALKDIIDQLPDGQVQIEQYDPNEPPPPGTDYLVIGGTGEQIDLSSQGVGNVPIIDASGAETGIRLDLEDETGDGLPETRVVLGSNYDDVVLGGETNLSVDMGAGDDTVFISGGKENFIDGGEGDDSVVFSGSQSDWRSVEDPDTGAVTWTNDSTGQTVTLKNVEHWSFEADSTSQALQEAPDPDLDADF